MNKSTTRIIIALFLLMTQGFYPIKAALLEPSYICTVQFPSYFETKPPLQARFKGIKFIIKDGTALLPADTGDIFYILITHEIKACQKKDGAVGLKRIAGAPYKWFSIVRISTATFCPGQKPWIIEEKAVEEMLPEDSAILIVLLNPDDVEGLAISTSLCQSAQEIPSIRIKNTVEEKLFCESTVFAEISALDTNGFHVAPTRALRRGPDGLAVSRKTSQHR